MSNVVIGGLNVNAEGFGVLRKTTYSKENDGYLSLHFTKPEETKSKETATPSGENKGTIAENGIDEIVLTTIPRSESEEAKPYIVYGRGLRYMDTFKKGVTYDVRLEGKEYKAKVIHLNNEKNTLWEGVKTGVKGGIGKTTEVVGEASQNMIKAVGNNGLSILVGTVTGVTTLPILAHLVKSTIPISETIGRAKSGLKIAATMIGAVLGGAIVLSFVSGVFDGMNRSKTKEADYNTVFNLIE